MVGRIIKMLFLGMLILALIVFGIFIAFIYLMGRNFVHDKPASPAYYTHVANRVGFTTKYHGDKFDKLLDSFLKTNPQYVFVDSTRLLGHNDSCNCDCLPFTRTVYFNSPPREVYEITYDYDTMYAAGAGIVDIVFVYQNNKWICTKSSKFDSADRERIRNRLDTSILRKL
jgi:hypothetical protein